jgi:protein transport protein SEC31
MKLKEIHRTSTFAWSPLSAPLLATGTVAGALDESFSNDSQLEIWSLDFLNKQEYELGGEGQHRPRGSVANSSRSAIRSFLGVPNVECFPCQIQSYRLGKGRW